jgi:hypothetical protein
MVLLNFYKNSRALVFSNTSIIDALFLCALIISYAFQTPQMIVLSYISAIIYLCLEPINVSKYFLLIYSLAASFFMLSAFKFNFGYSPMLYIIGALFLYLSATRFTSRSINSIYDTLKICYYIFISCLYLQIINNLNSPSPLESFFPGTSANGISSYLIVFQIAYSLIFFLKLNRLPIFSSLNTFIVSYFCLGRASIVVSLLILIFSLCSNQKNKKKFKKQKLLLLSSVLLVLTCFIFKYYVQLSNFIAPLYSYTRFSTGLTDPHRAIMIIDYFSKIDMKTLFLGADYINTSILNLYGGNPHNSFIRVHSFYGLAGLVSIFIPIFFLLKSEKLVSQKIITLILISFALFRGSTEPIFFPGVLDFFYFFYFLVFFKFSKRSD